MENCKNKRLKAVTIMNFVRQCEPRDAENDKVLFDTTRKQLEYLNTTGKDNTFLLQYDTLCDQRYIDLFKEKGTEKTELGLWFEVVKYLTDAVGMEYRSEFGWEWDWHIIPGFSMAYTPREREMLIDEAMRKFRERFGYYPKTVGSWLLDTHTVNYLTSRYDIDTICICRDQTNTDAYTLVGGYFNQAFYPSKMNMFTPAQTEEYQVNVPVFRLLGPDPIHNYDRDKYASKEMNGVVCCTLELAWEAGTNEKMVDWYFDTYYENEDLGFSYAQLGQENSFGLSDLVTPLKNQLEKLDKHSDIKYLKMSDAGKEFRKKYPVKTPATCVTALNNWDSVDIQSVYYDSCNYTANIFRHGKKLFFRSFYLFDEKVPEHYLTESCKTFDAVYENLPIVDTVIWAKDKADTGLMISENAGPFTVKKTGESGLFVYPEKNKGKCVRKKEGVQFLEDRIEVYYDNLEFDPSEPKAEIKAENDRLSYVYKGTKYALKVENGGVSKCEKCGKFFFERKNKEGKLPMVLIPERK